MEVEDVCGRDGHGGQLEDGESDLIDRVREYLSGTVPRAQPAASAEPCKSEAIRIGNLPTINQDEYPGLGDWWVQLRIGNEGDEVLARVYGDTPAQARNRAVALATPITAQPSVPECPQCGTHEVSLERTCHNSACQGYGRAVTVHEGWRTTPPATGHPRCADVFRQSVWFDFHKRLPRQQTSLAQCCAARLLDTKPLRISAQAYRRCRPSVWRCQ